MKTLHFLGVLATTPRVGQNAVLGSLRHVFPGAGEWGAASPVDRRFVYATAASRPWSPSCRRAFCRIRRIDLVAQAVSWQVAAKNGRFHSWQEDTSDGPLEYDRDDVDRAIATIRDRELHWDEELRRETVMTLVYEDDILPDVQAAAQSVLDFWEIPGEAGPTDVWPTDSEVKLEWIQRYKDGK